MTNQRRILEHCLNFDEIINSDFLEEDLLTKRLIEYYQDYVFKIDEGDNNQVDLIKKLDKAMYRYIADYRFAKSLKETLDIDAVVSNDFPYLDQLMQYIIHFFDKYQEEDSVSIVETHWI